MKRLLVALVGLAMVLTAGAQNKEERECAAFTGIEVTKGANVTLFQESDKTFLEVVTEGCPLSDVQTNVKNGVLVVSMRKRTAGSAVQVIVHFKDLNDILVKRGASIDTQSGCPFVHKGKLRLDVGAQSEVEMDIDVDELEVSANTCMIKLEGRADVQNVKVNGTVGAAKYDAEDLKSKRVTIKATETDSKVQFTEALEAEAVHCTIAYDGDTDKVTKKEKVGGEVVKL